MDYEKQIVYWAEESRRSWRSVPTLEDGEFWEEALFWAHLALEKALKAHVVRTTRDLPPYTHKLTRLAEIAGFILSADQQILCEILLEYHVRARYSEPEVKDVDGQTARRYLAETREWCEWLLKQL